MGGTPLLDLPFEDVRDVAARRPRGPETGERRLARAILADVLVTLRAPETLQWIADDVDEYPDALPLSWVADQLRVPVAPLRERLLWLASDGKVEFKYRQRGIEMVERIVASIPETPASAEPDTEGEHVATG